MEEKDNKVREILWNLAGFKKDIIKTCKVDSYHSGIIGTLLFIVGIYSALAWTFFFLTVTSNPFMPVIAGLFMGFYIVSFDRALIASMSSGSTNLYSIGFRLLLATLLGIFLAQPMILKFYEPDIKREAQILVDKKNQERKKELEIVYKFDADQLKQQKTDLENILSNKEKLLNHAETDFKTEMDGSGGTKRWGYNIVSQQKEKIFKQHLEEYQKTADTLQPKIATIQEKINEINTKIAKEFEDFKQSNTAFGTLIQVEALQSLLTKDKTGSLRMRYYLLVFILALIELSALIAKMLYGTRSYKSKANFITEEEVKSSENDKEIILAKLEEYKNLTLENELALIRKFFTEAKEVNHSKLDEMMAEYRNGKDKTNKDLWEQFTKKCFIKE